jgi:Toprim domain/CHC2 zinc finger
MSRMRSNAPAERAAWAEQARAVRIEDEIARRGIKLRGRADRCGPCPVCGGDDRFSINLKKQVFGCRKCGARGGDAIALVQFLDGLGFKEAIAYLAGPDPQRTEYSVRKQREATTKQSNEELPNNGTRNLALALWRASIEPRGTLVEQYLKSRALELPREAAFEAIRFHPACPFMAERFPAMICLVRNIVSNEPQGIHRTALTPEGRAVKRPDKEGRLKTFRMSLGPAGGGAIKVDPDEDVTQGVCIGEGVETCLAGRQMGLWPVWSAVSIGGIKNFPILPRLWGLHILKENDANGKSAEDVAACARRWYDAGRDVIIVEPDAGKDLNDELLAAVR